LNHAIIEYGFKAADFDLNQEMMSFILTLFNSPAYIIWPVDRLGISAFAVMAAGIIFGNWHWRDYQRDMKERQWFLFGVLLTLAPFTALFLGFNLPQWGAIPLPELSLEPAGGTLMILAALPVVVSAWILGPISASLIGLVSGICLAYWDTHSPFTIVEFVTFSLLVSVAIRQRYRTAVFSILRRPFLATLLIACVHYLLNIAGAFFWASGSIVENLDFAISNSRVGVVALAGSFALAGLVTEFALVALPRVDGIKKKLKPSPSESSIKVRFLNYVVSLTLVLVLVLLLVNWFVAGRSAEKMVQLQMENIARTTTNKIPFFFNTGQSLISQYASDLSGGMTIPEDLDQILRRNFRSIPFFSQLYVFDSNQEPIGAYPDQEVPDTSFTTEFHSGLRSALNGVPVQVYVTPPSGIGNKTVITFMGSIPTEDGLPGGVLVGLADLESNPFTQPILSDLVGINDLGGVGYLLDEQGRVLYSSKENLFGLFFPSFELTPDEVFSKQTTSDGTRQLVYIRSALGRPWTVMLTIPAVKAQQLALDLAAPLSGVVLLISVLTMAVMYIGLSSVADSLHILTEEADRITKGELDHPLRMTRRVDEVGQLRRAFEKMRRSLKNRMVELNRLLNVSQGVASSLEMADAVDTILSSALEIGACSARIVLDADILPEHFSENAEMTCIGSGEDTAAFCYLDSQILEIARSRSPVMLTNPARMPLLDLNEDDPVPGAILIVALQHEQQYYGAIWLAYLEPHNFLDSEVRFIVTLAGQAALAAANSSLFGRAEIGRKRLAAILASTPDPILVLDHQDKLLLTNPVAAELLGLEEEFGIGEKIEEVTTHQELIVLLNTTSSEKVSKEVKLEDGRVFLATASPVISGEHQLGRVCVLRDISQLKEMDELKSDFVSTVSHDLRSPLTLMRGYATMLEMVGELNEQQQNYVHKIITGVESMSHLVQNLLDLGRIEAEVGLKLDMVSAPDIISEVTDSFKIRASQKKITIHVSQPNQTIPFISADKALLQQALRNLVDNALNFNQQEGEVWIRYMMEDGRIIFEVEDTGIGISPVDQQHLFEQFYRVESREKDKQGGTGLGLAIVKSIAERHGGKAWVESELGSGSIFYLAVPIRQPERKIKAE
jgi:PAS domain S-box-containing protein